MNSSILKALIVALLCYTVCIGHAQNPYKTTWKGEAAWLGGSGAGISIFAILHTHNKPFTVDQVHALNLGTVPKFDRFATRFYSQSARKASDIMVASSLILPGLLLIDKDIRRDAPTAALIVSESVLLDFAITSIVKEIVLRPRPFNFNPDVPISEKLKRKARYSYFSGHTSLSASATFSAARIWSDYHPDSGWKPVVWATAAVIPATVGFLRVKAGKHYLTDVLTGFVVGGACGLLVPHFHRQNR